MRAKHLIVLLIFLVSCAPQISETPSSDNTITPSATAEILNTPTALPTATESEVDKIFVIPTKDSSFVFGFTPTPIAAPNDNLPIRLRDLSESDYINWIGELQRYSYQNYPSYGDWWSDGMFISTQITLGFAIQEYLYKYPNTANAERLRWQLAFIDSIVFKYTSIVGGNIYDDNWVITELEKKLNQDEVTPENLEILLDQYWFDVDYSQPINNLFGKEETSWFYVIKPQVWAEEEDYPKSSDYFPYGGLFIVIRKIDNDNFKIYLLENGLSFVNGASSLFEISDFNQNGITEIALNIGYHSGSMCAGNFSIYEWRNNNFEDITKKAIEIHNCGDSQEYSIIDETPSIIERRIFQLVPSIYKWDGTYYEFSGYIHLNLIEKWWSAISSSEEPQAIEDILASEKFEGLDAAHVDFLRYRLGIVYALNSNKQKAVRTLQDLIDNPLDTTRTVYSDFAKNFLKYYTGDQNLYLACQKSQEILDKFTNHTYSEKPEELFGIPFDFVFGIGLLRCFDDDVFNLLIGKIPVEVEDLPGELRKNGVHLYYAEKRDVNLDGFLEEWLVIIDGGVFVVMPDKDNYSARELEYSWYGDDLSRYSNVTVDISKWGGLQESILRISNHKETTVLSVSYDYKSTWLASEYDVKDIVFSGTDIPAQYQVMYIKPNPESFSPDTPWRGYRWDSAHQEFKEDLLEYTIFVEKDIQKSVEIAGKLLPMLDNWKDIVDQWSDLPRYYYFCALSYELAGDSQKAAEIYWQLWRDFPESQYALLARYKLEPVSH